MALTLELYLAGRRLRLYRHPCPGAHDDVLESGLRVGVGIPYLPTQAYFHEHQTLTPHHTPPQQWHGNYWLRIALTRSTSREMRPTETLWIKPKRSSHKECSTRHNGTSEMHQVHPLCVMQILLCLLEAHDTLILRSARPQLELGYNDVDKNTQGIFFFYWLPISHQHCCI